tara:strand:+ start:215 stop:487 length:273 start_codon:yes stop_codon:yes gene_type:complete
MNIITEDYYNNRTYDMLVNQITKEDIYYIQSNNETIEDFLYKRWNMIVKSLPSNYYEQYSSYKSQEERNDWFQRYLDLPRKDISLMPEIL